MFKVGQKFKVIATAEELDKIDIPSKFVNAKGIINKVHLSNFGSNIYAYDLDVTLNGSKNWGINRNMIKVLP